MFFGSSLMAWKSKRQSIATLSTFESETVAGCLLTRMILAKRHVLKDIFGQMKTSTLKGDNKPCMDAMHSSNHSSQRSKHVDIKCKFMGQHVDGGDCVHLHVRTEENLADMLTKSQKTPVFDNVMNGLIQGSPSG